MRSASTIFATCVASASAFSYPAMQGTGVGASPAHTHIREKNKHPNATTAVEFTFGTQSDWTLRINLTELSVPDAKGPDPLTDPRYFNTVYGLEWPGHNRLNKTISAATESSEDPKLCVDIVYSSFPENVTNAYQESDAGSCESALGKACVDALKHRYALSTQNECVGALPDSIPECTGSFKAEYEAFGFEVNSGPAPVSGADHSDRDLDSFPLQNGGGFAFKSSSAYNGTDRSGYDAEAGRLQMVVFSSGGNVYPLCARIDGKSKSTSTSDSPSSSASPSGSAAPTSSHNAAANLANTGSYLLGALMGASVISYAL